MPLVKIPVSSSAIAGLEWDDLDQSLFVSFQKGGTYILRSVPLEEAERFARSPSPGSYWNLFMKGKY
jgi:hypothetical protein